MMKSVNRIRMLATMLAAAFLFTGCEKENENTVDNQPVKARITSTIDGMATRAAGTAWAKGDQIGIYAKKNGQEIRINAPYVTTDGHGVFTATDKEFYFQDKEEHQFSAYYPFEGNDGTAPGSNGTISKTITANDQTAAAQPKIDYLFASATGSSASPNVQFQFNHRMSRIVLNFLSGDGITALEDIEYTLDGIVLEGTFNTRTGDAAASPGGSTPSLTMSVSAPQSGSAATELTSALIFFPQQSNDDKTLTLTMGGTTYTSTFKFKENPNNGSVRELAAGHTYTYNVKINNTLMTIDLATVNEWESGGEQDVISEY